MRRNPETASYNAAKQAAWTTVKSASNGFAYDASGNVTFDGNNSYAYDSEGQVCAVQNSPISGGTVAYGYLYDAEGRRVAKGTIAVTSTPLAPSVCNPATNGFTLTESYVLGQGGEQLTTLNQSGIWQRTNVYGEGKLLATYDTAGLHFHLTDPLGTPAGGSPDWTSLSENSGPVGTLVSINGNNLLDGGNNATVTFNGTPAAISSNTASQIQVTVPPCATSGPVRILVNGVLVLTNFTVTSIVPEITSVSPNYGAPSAFITLTGTGFGATQGYGLVIVGEARPEVTAWSDASITFRVPSTAATGNIVVVETNRQTSNGEAFT